MVSQDNTGGALKRTHWATASFVLSFAGWASAVTMCLGPPDPIVFLQGTILCWVCSLVCGVVAFAVIGRERSLRRGKALAVVGVSASVVGTLLLVSFPYFAVLWAMRGEPYDESNPSSIRAYIEENCEFTFPEKVNYLKAADRIPGGIGPAYVLFIVKFTTDHSGFLHLCNCLSRLGDWGETDAQFYSKEDGRGDPRVHVSIKETPEWYAEPIPKGTVYAGFATCQSKKRLRLTTVCVKPEDSEEYVVYMEGDGDADLKRSQN